MLTRRLILMGSAIGAVATYATWWSPGDSQAETTFAITHTDADWRKLLTGEQYAILRRSATERPFTSPLNHEKRRGNFACVGCDLDLFSSTTKFESGTGWPSFWAPLDNAVGTERDTRSGWFGRRFIALAAAATSVTFLTTVRSPRACATV